ncbi:MAG: MarR family winged helix-turn-helix transcriptional regulator [Pseudomonadales bacterium]
MFDARNTGQVLMLLTRDFHRRMEKNLGGAGIEGISKRHRSVFLYIGRFGPSRMVDIARADNIRPQSMMVIINELEAMGLVDRQPDPVDSRAKLIGFTEQGRGFIQTMQDTTVDIWSEYQVLLGDGEAERTFLNLQKLLDNVEQENNDD